MKPIFFMMIKGKKALLNIEIYIDLMATNLNNIF